MMVTRQFEIRGIELKIRFIEVFDLPSVRIKYIEMNNYNAICFTCFNYTHLYFKEYSNDDVLIVFNNRLPIAQVVFGKTVRL